MTDEQIQALGRKSWNIGYKEGLKAGLKHGYLAALEKIQMPDEELEKHIEGFGNMIEKKKNEMKT